MERLKDIFYNKSDLLITIVIVILAGLLIWSRVGAIMSYSTPQPRGEGTTTEAPVTASSVTGGAVTGSAAEGAESGETGDSVSLYINSGDTIDTIAQNLYAAELVESPDEFIDAINKANAATGIKAGSFMIPMGSTPEEIVAILTD